MEVHNGKQYLGHTRQERQILFISTTCVCRKITIHRHPAFLLRWRRVLNHPNGSPLSIDSSPWGGRYLGNLNKCVPAGIFLLYYLSQQAHVRENNGQDDEEEIAPQDVSMIEAIG